jgi:hypothetical protein
MSRRWIVWGVPVGAGILLAAALAMKPESGVPAGDRPPLRLPVPERKVDREPERPSARIDPPRLVAVPAAPVDVVPSRLQEDSWPAYRERLEALSLRRAQQGEASYGASVLEETGRFLGFDASTLAAFDAVRLGVQADLERIQVDVGRELASHPVDLPDEELQRLQEEAVQRTLGDRRAALSRLEVFLEGRDNHQQFRGFLETWVLEFARMHP